MECTGFVYKKYRRSITEKLSGVFVGSVSFTENVRRSDMFTNRTKASRYSRFIPGAQYNIAGWIGLLRGELHKWAQQPDFVAKMMQ